ncbi:potassium channel family protein [Rubrivirga sp. IMCC43871]|uniref:potassium channel family protein n=1 Tax=Rubrivirga sp. IMCC43871 TaxID=3391575 RepID=UPI00398FB944
MGSQTGALREVVLGTLAVAALLGLGAGGYMLIERWSLMDAVYMSGITLTTIGFGEVRPLSPLGQVFTLALAFVGIGTFAFIASRVVQILVTTDALRQRAMQRRIDNLSGHYVIAGYGRLGQRIALDLVAAGRDFVVVDRRDDRAEQLDAEGFPYVKDDAEEESTLQAAGLERAAGLVLVLPQDAANVFVALTARELMDGRDLFIVARTNEQTSQRKLLRAGVDKVISPLEIGADRIAQTILRPRVDRFMEKVLGVDALDFDLEEVTVEAGSLLDGRSLSEVDFRRHFQAIVVGVLRSATGEWQFNPDAQLALAEGDTLIVLATAEQIRKIRTEGATPLSKVSIK